MLEKPNSKTGRIFDYIVRYKKQNDGNSPSLDQIAEDMKMAKSSVHGHVAMLVTLGKIRITGGKAKSIIVVGGEWKAN